MKSKNNQEEKKKSLSLREKKHQANLKNNSSLHFQIGLIVVLFMVFGLFQLEFEKKTFVTSPIAMTPEEDGIIVPHDWVIDEPKKEIIEAPVTEVKKPTDLFEEVPDETILKEVLPKFNKPSVDSNPVKVGDVKVEEAPEDLAPISINLVQVLPVFPGCERFETKKEKMKCFMSKVSKHINKKFDSDIAVDNDITGKQKIFVMFTINAKGEIEDIKARSPFKVLEKEAIESVQSLPKMTPAKQGYKKVAVTYTLPINLLVE